jgi:hypothetical protein
MPKDPSSYLHVTSKVRFEKSINSLLGIVEGISADAKINPTEIGFLRNWVGEHLAVAGKHPFNELVPLVTRALNDGVLSEDEHKDIVWLCDRLRSSTYFDVITADMQRLQAIVGAIAADGEVTAEELRGLSKWLTDHEHLKTCWPYDEIDSVVTSILADGRVDDEEHRLVHRFFSEFTAVLDERTIVSPPISENATLTGLCAVCPEISFPDSTFCFTGESSKYSRSELAAFARDLGGSVLSGVSGKLNYLVIGADGNPCWAYACYGRKVEKAVELRKQGKPIVIVHEFDFHDAVADAKSGI